MLKALSCNVITTYISWKSPLNPFIEKKTNIYKHQSNEIYSFIVKKMNFKEVAQNSVITISCSTISYQVPSATSNQVPSINHRDTRKWFAQHFKGREKSCIYNPIWWWPRLFTFKPSKQFFYFRFFHELNFDPSRYLHMQLNTQRTILSNMLCHPCQIY